MASCISAPITTGIRLNAAAIMPTSASPSPRHTAWIITRLVRREMATARGTAAMSSFMITTCADSEAAVEVPSVMAMPISAAASTGASFTPSPTIIVMDRVVDSPTNRAISLSHHGCRFGFSRFASTMACTLPSGNSSACTSLMPTSEAMMSAEARLSPVNMVRRSTPMPRSLSRDSLALARGTSLSTMRAASSPSTAT